jgi:hypothetical protein
VQPSGGIRSRLGTLGAYSQGAWNSLAQIASRRREPEWIPVQVVQDVPRLRRTPSSDKCRLFARRRSQHQDHCRFAEGALNLRHLHVVCW